MSFDPHRASDRRITELEHAERVQRVLAAGLDRTLRASEIEVETLRAALAEIKELARANLFDGGPLWIASIYRIAGCAALNLSHPHQNG